jgi:hypothetical protein
MNKGLAASLVAVAFLAAAGCASTDEKSGSSPKMSGGGSVGGVSFGKRTPEDNRPFDVRRKKRPDWEGPYSMIQSAFRRCKYSGGSKPYVYIEMDHKNTKSAQNPHVKAWCTREPQPGQG